MKIDLYPHQLEALGKMHNGCVLRGGVGSGKSITSLAYFFTRVMGGSLNINDRGETEAFERPNISTLLIITPAIKRDGLEWDRECSRFGLGKDPEASFGRVRVIIDSWNNILKYTDITDAFVIFDEQRLVGSGAWVKAFYKIARKNLWILLSATPGDTWMDYIPVFVANGYYKNRTAFIDRHVVFSKYSKFPKVERYVEEGRLQRLRYKVLVEMPFARHTRRHVRTVVAGHDTDIYKKLGDTKWNIFTEEPIKNITELIYAFRRVVNSDISRLDKLEELWVKHKRLIVFYNFTYELDLMREFLSRKGITYSERNGQKHQEIPDTDSWIYLVQYAAGSDAWNCTLTDSMVFYSLQYSYRTFEQCQGRIDRLNTLYEDLYYYVFRSNSVIDQAIWKALVKKENFNTKSFEKKMDFVFDE